MTARTGECPSCGATITFRWAQAVQTVCPYCLSVLVRGDLDLERIGQVSSIPLTPSPLQLGTSGSWRERRFTLVGRLTYQYGRGRWNEWHALLDDGSSAWLADAQLEYTMTRAADSALIPPGNAHLQAGATIEIAGVRYVVRGVTEAHYVGTEGELPFVYWDKETVAFADCWTPDGRFATIDHSESPPLLFVGEAVEAADLRLTNLREFEGW
jgi:hypothetical protein